MWRLEALTARVLAAGTRDGMNVVAFSGGVDSSLVAQLVHRAFPGNSRACIGVSAALPQAQLRLARTIASHIGIPLREVPTAEGQDPGYIANRGESCFHCKSHLYSTLEALAADALSQGSSSDVSRAPWSNESDRVAVGPERSIQRYQCGR